MFIYFFIKDPYSLSIVSLLLLFGPTFIYLINHHIHLAHFTTLLFTLFTSPPMVADENPRPFSISWIWLTKLMACHQGQKKTGWQILLLYNLKYLVLFSNSRDLAKLTKNGLAFYSWRPMRSLLKLDSTVYVFRIIADILVILLN